MTEAYFNLSDGIFQARYNKPSNNTFKLYNLLIRLKSFMSFHLLNHYFSKFLNQEIPFYA